MTNQKSQHTHARTHAHTPEHRVQGPLQKQPRVGASVTTECIGSKTLETALSQKCSQRIISRERVVSRLFPSKKKITKRLTHHRASWPGPAVACSSVSLAGRNGKGPSMRSVRSRPFPARQGEVVGWWTIMTKARKWSDRPLQFVQIGRHISILPLNGQPEAGCLSCSAPIDVYHSDLRCGDPSRFMWKRRGR